MLQALLGADLLKERLVQEDNQLCGLLASLFDLQLNVRNGRQEDPVTDAVHLCREVLRGTSERLGQMQDVSEFWMFLFHKLPDEAKALFQFEQMLERCCHQCSHSERTAPDSPECVLRLSAPPGKPSWADVLSASSSSEGDANAQCSRCHQRGNLEFKTSLRLVGTKYLFVKLEMPDQRREITNFQNQSVRIEGMEFQTLAAVLFKSRK